MGITIEIKFIPDGKEQTCKKVLFNVAGCNAFTDKMTFFNIDGMPIFEIMLHELVSIDFIQ